MALTPGTRLGPYEITAQIGVGGMGEVYRATDTKLKRQVAIKVLPQALAGDAERLARFQREAEVLASLNHPNIAAIHGVESSALVMELAEGPTLAEIISRGALPIEEALPIALQIAEAFEYAHERGVIHRDLKPANIKVASEGAATKVKVLDFGLAKAFKNFEQFTEDPSNSPTMSAAVTEAGVILGTAGYMAPEQARGKTVDRRADVWAFGVVLYEMFTGRRLFAGETVSDVLAAVLTKEPDLGAVPADMRTVIERCLRKDPRRRWQSMGDVRLALEEGGSGAKVVSPAHLAPRRSFWPIVIAVLMALLAAGALWAPWRKPAATPELVKFEISPPAGATIKKFATSPDGRKVAYFASGAGGAGLWVRSFDDLNPVRISGDFAENPSIPSFFWSADSRFVAFPSGGRSTNRLMAADLAGGPPQMLAEIGTAIAGGSWGRDGTILFGSVTPGVWRVTAGGGKPVQLTASDPSHPSQCDCSPILLPDGRHFLYLIVASPLSESGIFVGSIDAKPSEQSRRRIVATAFAASFVPTEDPKVGILLFLRDDVLLAQRLDLDTFQLTGTPARLASGVSNELEFGGFSASNTGVLAYQIGPSQGSSLFTLKWFDKKGESIPSPSAALLDQVLAHYGIALSPDGSRAAVSHLDSAALASTDIWSLDFAQNSAVAKLTSKSANHDNRNPVWSPDGIQIAYASGQADGKGSALAKRSSNGSGAEDVVLPSNGKERHLNHWSRDGFLLFAEQGEKTKSDLWFVPVNGARTPEVFLHDDFNETEGQFSPDGHWVAYVSDETGQTQVYIQPFPQGAGDGGKIPVSSTQGSMPRWRRDGKELFFVQGATKVMAVDFTPTPTAKVGIPRELFQLVIGSASPQTFLWDVTPLGDRFLFSLPNIGSSNAPLTVLLNWQRMLEK